MLFLDYKKDVLVQLVPDQCAIWHANAEAAEVLTLEDPSDPRFQREGVFAPSQFAPTGSGRNQANHVCWDDN